MGEPTMPTPEEIKKMSEHFKEKEAEELRETEASKKAGLSPQEWHDEHRFDPETGEDISELGKE
jgi:hypothetical protein